MLSRGECEKALGYFFENVIDDCPTKLDIKYFEVLENLIEEHFDNPPLKFDELKEGMWVWDSQLKWFFRISICNVKIENFEYIKFFKVEKYEGGSMLMFYEPNRFYKKKVKE